MRKDSLKNLPIIDVTELRREIAMAHYRIHKWEESCSETPTAHVHWTKLAEFVGPNLKQALSLQFAWIEISPDTGKPQFVTKED